MCHVRKKNDLKLIDYIDKNTFKIVLMNKNCFHSFVRSWLRASNLCIEFEWKTWQIEVLLIMVYWTAWIEVCTARLKIKIKMNNLLDRIAFCMVVITAFLIVIENRQQTKWKNRRLMPKFMWLLYVKFI